MDLKEILKYKKIAVVGASRDPSKWAHIVPRYLKEKGYRVVPVNPTASEVLGERAYPTLLDIPEDIDIVQVFRPTEEVPRIAEEVLARKRTRGDVKVLWLQLGITAPEEVKRRLEREGIVVVENMCMMETHMRLFGG
ncbi:CoA-binding protein [Thermoproteus tenax]|uniref:Predicted CoA-binding protein n=1 Tax=Thermoproteus tenax (strain ATCC 35583 / DSM 2078 / JCM 9277 / NBRC 100435 / Kra 1) TaxID=768679 RepID=G4RK63_THETK|nr:CoA-binding protein [Thermoproteus tenax]CCC81958.1 Predicted CoA-binding protein [Thermoproteus tenax Kra 1]